MVKFVVKVVEKVQQLLPVRLVFYTRLQAGYRQSIVARR